jgi:hypothetical protein
MGDAVPQTLWDLPLLFPEWMLSALLDAATAVQSICLLGGQGNEGTRPERRCKSGMDGGLTAASFVSSPPLYLRTAVFLSNQPGPFHRTSMHGSNPRRHQSDIDWALAFESECVAYKKKIIKNR